MSSLAKKSSWLSIVQDCDNFPYDRDAWKQYYRLFLEGDQQPNGYILPEIMARLPKVEGVSISDEPTGRSYRVCEASANPKKDSKTTARAVNATFQRIADECVEKDLFHCIGAQHSEPFAIPTAPYPVQIERYAAALFGITQRGAHLTATTRTSDGELRFWVPRRAEHLYTSPGKLDASVAGGIKASTTPLETIIAEAGEEASLPADLVRSRIRSAGALTYVSVTNENNFPGEKGLVIPDMIYAFDIELPADVVPRPHDDEVKDFQLMGVAEVQERLLNREFKPDAAMVYVDFFIRHGYITAENEPHLAEICTHLHRRLPFGCTPHRNDDT
ncbi:hypothetical protein F5Y15DRAFT_180122 [Xylariaceae sp. FL0016]|nr:hypothetical protein F5Y15DRAFT_180122 [Xylariaceae sp. FL0016]